MAYVTQGSVDTEPCGHCERISSTTHSRLDTRRSHRRVIPRQLKYHASHAVGLVSIPIKLNFTHKHEQPSDLQQQQMVGRSCYGHIVWSTKMLLEKQLKSNLGFLN